MIAPLRDDYRERICAQHHLARSTTRATNHTTGRGSPAVWNSVQNLSRMRIRSNFDPLSAWRFKARKNALVESGGWVVQHKLLGGVF
jgi:hypothetical protein